MNFHIDDVRAYTLALHRIAADYAHQLGFSYVGCADDECPQTLLAMTSLARWCKRNAEAFPVSNEHCDESICGIGGDPAANMALRFIHDIDHVRYQLGTSIPDEVLLATHLADMFAKRYGHTSKVTELARIDMLGSVTFLAQHGRFPTGHEVLEYCHATIDGV